MRSPFRKSLAGLRSGISPIALAAAAPYVPPVEDPVLPPPGDPVPPTDTPTDPDTGTNEPGVDPDYSEPTRIEIEGGQAVIRTSNDPGTFGVSYVAPAISGGEYWEFTVANGTPKNATFAVGIATLALPLNGIPGARATEVAWWSDGTIRQGGATILDLGAAGALARGDRGGLWYGSDGALRLSKNCAALNGGAAVGSLVTADPVHPFAALYSEKTKLTFTFAASKFGCPVPSGFYPIGQVPPTPLSTPPLSSSYASVYDATSGWPLYAKSDTTVTLANEAASTAKLATALVAFELVASGTVALADSVTVAADELVPGTTAGLMSGDVISLEDLLYGVFLPSGNDAAEALARYVGTAIHSAAGSIGATGRARFVEEMNALAARLGMASTTYESPHGVEVSPGGGTTDQNFTTAADLSILGAAAYGNSALRTIAGTATRTATVTGANARSILWHHTSDLINQTAATGGIADSNVLASKGGQSSGTPRHSLVAYWQTPAGQKVVITTISSDADAHRYLDQRAIYYQLCADFPYLAATPAPDPAIASVKLLVGADGSVLDESPAARLLTASGAVVSAARPMIGAGSLFFDGVDDVVEASDAADLSPGASDFAVEFFMKGSGAEPGAFVAFVSKYNTTGSQREWTVQYDPGTNRIVFFVSTDGANFLESSFDLDDFGIDAPTFFNGAMRHVLARRSGSEVSVYVNGVKGGLNYAIGSTAIFNSTTKLKLGARDAGAGSEAFFAGSLDEIRLTIGAARQTAAKFTPSVLAHSRS